jgi:hypothetical protein
MDEKVYILGSTAHGPTSWDEETQEKKDGQLKSIGGERIIIRHVSASYLST